MQLKVGGRNLETHNLETYCPSMQCKRLIGTREGNEELMGRNYTFVFLQNILIYFLYRSLGLFLNNKHSNVIVDNI